jgi:hypothetical protein
MNLTLTIILIFLFVILLIYRNYNNLELFTFDVNNPNFYKQSCKHLDNEKKKVDKLSNKYCDQKNIKNIKYPNRIAINNNENCYDATTRKINIDNERANWCSRLETEQQKIIEKELKNIKFDNENEYEGPEFMEKQLAIMNEVEPHSKDNTYANFNIYSENSPSNKTPQYLKK